MRLQFKNYVLCDSSGEWVHSWSPMWLCGQGLKNATVGIVGVGRIGQSILKRLSAFGIAKALYYDVIRPVPAGCIKIYDYLHI
ncbi:UNVERIFIED_CONTAM: Grhpr [Trichonephila clavipes]